MEDLSSVKTTVSRLQSDEQDFRDACNIGDLEKLDDIFNRLNDAELEHILTNDTDYATGTPLFEAVICGQPAAVCHLIQLECDLEKESLVNIFIPMVYKDLGTVLCLAAATGSHEIVTMLVNAGASVNHASQYSNPLTNACKGAYTEIVEILLEADAVPDAKTCGGKSALHSLCESCDNVLIARLLTAHGADVNMTDERGKTPLFYACLKGNCEIAEFLIQHSDSNLPNTKYIEYLWLLGAACACSEDRRDALRYWRWASCDEMCGIHYNCLIQDLLTDEQKTCGIVMSCSTPYDIDRIALNLFKMRLHSIVLLTLTLKGDDPLLLMLYSELASELLNNMIAEHNIHQLLVFGKALVENSTTPGNLCDCLNALVDSLLNAYELGRLESLNARNVELSLTVLLQQLVTAFTSLSTLSALDSDDSFSSTFPIQHQSRSLQDVMHEVIESILSTTRLVFIHSSTDISSVLKVVLPMLRSFMLAVIHKNCSRWHMESLVWKILLDHNSCRYSLCWVYDKLFPDQSVIHAFLSAGLNVDIRDKDRKTPLLVCLATKLYHTDLLKMILDAGGSVDLPDKNGLRPCDIISHAKYPEIDTLNYRSLKSLAAEAIIRSKVPYNSFPGPLKLYIEMRT